MQPLENAHALIVGIADYQGIRKLPRVEDARDLADVLADPALGGYPKDHVQLLEDAQATNQAIRAALERLAKSADADATVFLYFSGHGGRIDDGPHAGQYLLPVDTIYPSAENLARTAVSGAEFTAALAAIKARRLTVVLDCCHAGGIGEPRDLVPTEKVDPGLSDNYLEALKAGAGRAIIAATRATTPAYVRQGARYGIFTGHFLDGLRGSAPGAGGVIRIFDLYDYTQRKVVADQPNQHPVFKAELEENYALARYRGGAVPTAAKTAAEPPADGFAHDAYISFSKDKLDKTWARKTFLPALKGAGLNVVSEDDFALGAPLINEMERAVVQSRYTIGLLTPRSLADNFADLNSVLARHLGLEKSQRRFVGVLRERCTPRLSIRALYYLDMTDDDEFDINIARLVSQLRQAPEIRRTDD
jgi:uncharacterized caspase-like protein